MVTAKPLYLRIWRFCFDINKGVLIMLVSPFVLGRIYEHYLSSKMFKKVAILVLCTLLKSRL